MPQKKKRTHHVIVRRLVPRIARPEPVRYRYVLGIDDAEIEQLVSGICPEAVAKRAWECLKWQRDGQRNEARERAAEHPPRKHLRPR